MSDTEKTQPTVPESKVITKPRRGFSFIWLIPLVAALAGGWIAVTTIRDQGPKITIIFKTAEGLEANKTVIRYNGIEVGEIGTIRISDDHLHVVATAKMSPKTEKFLVKDTKFWVVKPQISGANISGLSTLISGAYIGVEIGQSPESTREFTALDDAPLETGGVHGRFFTLKTPQLGSLNKGTPIYFRRLQAGQVADYELDPSGKFLNVKVFVQSPYDQFVTADTRFWQASGLDVSLTASGLRVQTESFLSILIGGIAFETPEASTTLPPAEANATFALNKDRDDAFRPPAHNPQIFRIEFKQSVRGLTVGAPVEFVGIPIGEVTDIQAQLDANTYEFSVLVTIQVDPVRFGLEVLSVAPGEDLVADHKKFMNALVARGLRAQLKSGSLLTGAQLVSLDFFPDAPPVSLDWSHAPVQLPTQPGKMETLEASVSGIVKKLDQIPFGEIGTNLNRTIGNLDQTIVGTRGTLTNADQLLLNASKMIAPDSALDAQLNYMLQQAGGAAQAMRVLADYLERHPESLLRGKGGETK